MSESTGTLRVKRSSSCAISIVELSQDGQFVKLSNGSTSKDMDLSDWSLERKHPKSKVPSRYQFPKGYKLKPGANVKIWANAFNDLAVGDDMIAGNDCKTWGCGNGSLELKNKEGDVKASSTMTYELK